LVLEVLAMQVVVLFLVLVVLESQAVALEGLQRQLEHKLVLLLLAV
jgi:hypothetical protein